MLIDRLIRESKSSSRNNLDEIPSDYYKLAKRIIKTESTNNQLTENEKKMLINFGLWLGLKMPIKNNDVHKHLISTWKEFHHTAEVRKTKDLEIPEEVLQIEGKKADTTKREMKKKAQANNTKNFCFVTNPECIVDKNNKTLVHLGELDDNKAVNTATEAVNNYYFHMVNNISY